MEPCESHLQFEHFCVAHYDTHHLRKDGEKLAYVVHSSEFSEDLLRECGCIATTSSKNGPHLSYVRKERVLHNGYLDYGVDAIAKHVDGLCSGLQMKMYTKKRLTANDIGTFQAVTCALRHANDTKTTTSHITIPHTHHDGFLYSVEETKTERNLEHIMQNHWPHVRMRYEKVKWACPLVDNCADAHTETPTLRDYQQDAVDALCSPTCPMKSLLHMPCGTGKTLVMAMALERLAYDVVVMCSPLVVSSQQNFKRILESQVLQTHIKVLGDHEHQTSITHFEDVLKSNNKVFIGTTFATASKVRDALSAHLGERKFCVVVDEAHNLTMTGNSCKGVWDMVEAADKSMFVTATPLASLVELEDIHVAYHMSFSEAIRKKVICDYRLWVPMISTAIGDNIFPVEIHEFSGEDGKHTEVAGYAFFLVAGMLRTGSRRCICYMKSKKQCDEFKSVLANVCKEFFGVQQSSSIVVEGTKSCDRAKALDSFGSLVMNTKAIVLNFLISVRILDEAVDIPTCDSIFVASPGCTTGRSMARTLQRLYRAGRRHTVAKPDNVCHAFLWVDGENEDDDNGVMEALQMLKDVDPYMRDKIHTMTCDYERTGEEDVVEKEVVNLAKFCERYKVDAREVQDVWRPGIDVKLKMLAECEEKPKQKQLVVVPENLVPDKWKGEHTAKPFQVKFGGFLNKIANNWSDTKKPHTYLTPAQKAIVSKAVWFDAWLQGLIAVRQENANAWSVDVEIKVQMLAECDAKPKRGHFAIVPDTLVPDRWKGAHCTKPFQVDLGGFLYNITNNWSDTDKPHTYLTPTQKANVSTTRWFDSWLQGVLSVREENANTWTIDVDTKVQMIRESVLEPKRGKLVVPDTLVPDEWKVAHRTNPFQVDLKVFLYNISHNWSNTKKPVVYLTPTQKATVAQASWFNSWLQKLLTVRRKNANTWVVDVDTKVQMLAECEVKPKRKQFVVVPDNLVPEKYKTSHETKPFRVDLGGFLNTIANNWSDTKKPLTSLTSIQKATVSKAPWFDAWFQGLVSVKERKSDTWTIDVETKVQMLAKCEVKPINKRLVIVPCTAVPNKWKAAHITKPFQVDLGGFLNSISNNWSDTTDKQKTCLTPAQKSIISKAPWFDAWLQCLLTVRHRNTNTWIIDADTKVEMLRASIVKPKQGQLVIVPENLVPEKWKMTHRVSPYTVRLGGFMSKIKNNWSKIHPPHTSLDRSQMSIVEKAPWFDEWLKGFHVVQQKNACASNLQGE